MNRRKEHGQHLARSDGKAADYALMEQDSSSALSADVITLADEAPEDDDRIDLRAYWRILIKRKWTVLVFLFIVIVAAVTATYLMTPMYRANLMLQIDKENIRVVEFQSVTPIESGWNSEQFYRTQYELLESKSLAERVATELDLVHNPAFKWAGATAGSDPGTGEGALQWLMGLVSNQPTQEGHEIPSLPEQTPASKIADALLGALLVDPVKNSRLVRLRYTSPDPQIAALVLNSWADTFIKLNLERRYDATAYARTFLEKRLKQLKEKLEASEGALAKYARDREIVNMGEQENTGTQELRQINEALISAREKRIRAEAIYDQITKTNHQGLTQVMDSPVVQGLKANLSTLEAEYQEDLKTFKPAYPKMKRLQSQITRVRQAISEEVNNVRAAIRTDYQAAYANEALLAQEFEKAKQGVLGLQDNSIKYRVLEREVDTNRELYKGLLQRYKEVGVSGAVGSNNISVVDTAQIPRQTYSPSWWKNLLLATIFGLFGGIGLALLFDHFDDSIEAPEQLEKVLQLTVLGTIPQVRAGDSQASGLAFLAVDDPRSAFAEAYRSLRTALQFITSEGFPKALLVTSAAMGEGKSTTALSLAINVAQTGKKVLLIDADLRNPSLHKTLGMDNSRGLTHCLTGEASPEEVVQPTPVAKLHVILTGPLPPNPAELLSSARMVSLLSLAKEKFALVVVDGPPVLGLADALILGNLMEGTLLVVEAGATRKGHALGAVKRLMSSHTRLLGGVLSKFDARAGGYGYHSGYYYYDYGAPQKKLT